MTREILLLQLGLGNVGQALARQVLDHGAALAERYGWQLRYLALADSRTMLATGAALPDRLVSSALQTKQAREPLATLEGARPLGDWRSLLPARPCIIVDVTAADGLAPGLAAAVADGHRVVLANKRPVTESFALFTALTTQGATRYEATVGAGLPIISTLCSLLDSGDTLTRIEASMSGTLGYLCTALEEGLPLSMALRTARGFGWTEPDPRDDLSGADVARKALILARTCGLAWEMADVPGVPWFTPELATISVGEFLDRVGELDAIYVERVAQAQARSKVLRYVAAIEPAGASIDLHELSPDHPLAALRGSDNLFAFTTERYTEHPLVVRGPGAGVAVTAAGVFGDIIATARAMEAGT